MNTRVKAAVLAALCVMAGPLHAADLNAGDWVLAQWKGESYWFPGVVMATSGDNVAIRYDDGTEETLSRSKVKPYDWRAGSAVECRWQGGQEWYRGNIIGTAADGVSISVKYEDGDSEVTRTGACRSR